MDPRRLFVSIARAEGMSLLLLFFVAMPLKYVGGLEHATQGPGWIHGVLFVAYCAALAWVSVVERWNPLLAIVAVVASFLPLGTFWFETRMPPPSPKASPD